MDLLTTALQKLEVKYVVKVESWDKTQKVTLKVDAATAFQQFVDITDILSKYEIKNVAIVTLKPQGSE